MADSGKKGKGKPNPSNNEKKQEAPTKGKPEEKGQAQQKDNKQPPQKDNKQPPAKGTNENKKNEGAAKGKPETKPVEAPVKESKKEETQAPIIPTPNSNNPQPVVNQNSQTRPNEKKTPTRDYVRGKGTVKSVISGDSLVIIHLEKGKLPQEKEITISNISAPKLGRRSNKEVKDNTPDEDFAFASREFLRKAVIGRNVSYTIESKPEKKGREFGIVILISKDGKETDLAQLIVSEGWAKVKRRTPKEGETTPQPLRADVEELTKLEEEAKRNSKGIFTKNATAIQNAKRPVHIFNASEAYERFKGAPQQGVVERVFTGSTLFVTLLPSCQEVKLLLSGVECPGLNLDSGEFEPLGREAKFCTEFFLLHRDVQVILEGADKFSLFGTLDFNGNIISEELLKRGFAKYVDWSGNRTAFAERLRAAEKGAKERKIGIWGSYVEPKALTRQEEKKQVKPGKEINGRVIAIINSGLVTVLDAQNAEHNVSLSSIVVPRGGNMKPKKKEDKQEKNEPSVVGEAPKEKSGSVKEKERRERAEALERTYAWEGKEYLRKRLIGQRVRCVLDYVQPPSQNGPQQSKEDRTYYSVYLDKNNVAVELVAAGLALPRNHRGGEQRSKDYEDIMKAEAVAKKALKGRFHPEDRASVLYINDISQDSEKARKFLPSIKRSRQRGVVIHVFNAGKVKVFVPKESCELTISISALKVPRQEEPFGAESAAFIRQRIHQRDVEFDVVNVDRGGNFVGNLFFNKENLAVLLLEQGYARLIRGIAQDSEHFADLDIAEERAKKALRGVWKDYDEAAEQLARETRREKYEAEKGGNQGNNKTEFMDVIITEILGATSFFVQIVGDEAAKLEDLMNTLSTESSTEAYTPKVKEIVKAQYSDDDNWYRATVISGDATSGFTVFYMDYGNSETIPTSRIRPLAEEHKVLKAQAIEAHLAYVKPPSINDDYGPEAADFLKELVEGKTMMANVEYRDGNGHLYLSLGDRESQVHVNAALVRAGLAKAKRPSRDAHILQPKSAVDQLIQKLREEEDKARSSHSGIWTYGDPGSDDDEEKPFRGGKKEKPEKKKSTSSPAVGKKEEKKE